MQSITSTASHQFETFPDALSLAVIIASTREGRFGGTVGGWFVDQARQRSYLVVDVIDLADTPLPTTLPSPAPPEVVAFTKRLDAADAFVVVTPEYNHSFPGPLKTAIDSARREWAAKPVAMVSYGGVSGGLRAVEQLRLVFADLNAVTIRNTVSFPLAHRQFGADSRPRDPEAVARSATALLDQLTWWARALRDARVDHPYGV
jgi:NAD(P)H-dependent FMN reductase